MQNFTLEEFSEFLQRENELVHAWCAEDTTTLEEAPTVSDESISRVLAYSKSVNVRKSEMLGDIRVMMN